MPVVSCSVAPMRPKEHEFGNNAKWPRNAPSPMPVGETSESGKMAKIFTPQVYVEISNLVAQGLSAAEIADRIGCTLNSLRVKCSQQGICLRRQSRLSSEDRPQGRLTVKLSGNTAVRLQEQAAKQGISGTRFAAALLEAVVRDNLYDAVIDQEIGSRGATKGAGSGLDHGRRAEALNSSARRPELKLVAKR
jgi:hypothetical protein